jgi:hypothetical protein
MNLNPKSLITDYRSLVATTLAFACLSAFAQPVVPQEAINQFQQVIGSRVEAVTILGGDYGAAGGFYTFRGGQAANLSISKIGGGGAVAAPKPLGVGDVEWAPVLQGNLGQISAQNEFPEGYLRGNKSVYDVLAVQAGGGVRFYFTDHFSLTPAISGIYAHTGNEFKPQNAIGDAVKLAAGGTYVDWQLDTWSVMPSLESLYDWQWHRTVFEYSSRYNYFHTESFDSSSPVVGVNGDSHTWENRIDADVPLGWKLLGRELHTGGFFSRTELFGGAADGLNADHVYTLSGRFVMDFLGVIPKVRWLGLGASYFFADHFDGWSAGVNMRFQF